jgi:hypothetical protein
MIGLRCGQRPTAPGSPRDLSHGHLAVARIGDVPRHARGIFVFPGLYVLFQTLREMIKALLPDDAAAARERAVLTSRYPLPMAPI